MQALAAGAGASLVNMEFMQFMPGMVSPRKGLVFNEKTFKYMRLPHDVLERLGGEHEARRLLELRSGYGPFTARLESRAVDLAIEEAGPQGLLLQPEFPRELPDFVQVYNSWLRSEVGVDPSAPLRVALYAHASNGGIRIGADASAGVAGLYAAGECTGGMHGADRLGGLSTANCLVFGMRAGESAARWAAHDASTLGERELPAWTAVASTAAQAAEEGMRAAMDEHCMALRSVAGLEQAAAVLERCARELEGGLAPSSARRCDFPPHGAAPADGCRHGGGGPQAPVQLRFALRRGLSAQRGAGCRELPRAALAFGHSSVILLRALVTAPT